LIEETAAVIKASSFLGDALDNILDDACFEVDALISILALASSTNVFDEDNDPALNEMRWRRRTQSSTILRWKKTP